MKQKTVSGLLLSGSILALALFAGAFIVQVPSPGLAGVWDIVPGNQNLQEGAFVEFVLKDGRWEGKFTASNGNVFPLETVRLEADRLFFSFETVAGGGPEASWIYSAKLETGRLIGTCHFASLEGIPFTAKKRKS